MSSTSRTWTTIGPAMKRDWVRALRISDGKTPFAGGRRDVVMSVARMRNRHV